MIIINSYQTSICSFVKKSYLAKEDIKGISTMVRNMETGSYTLKMVDTMRVNGSTIKWMDLEDFIIKMVKSLIKGIGKMMNLMGKGEFIIVIQLYLQDNSITKTFLSWETTGFIMKGSLKMILNMEKDI